MSTQTSTILTQVKDSVHSKEHLCCIPLPSVLIIDNDALNAKVLQKMLHRLHITQITNTTTGYDALLRIMNGEVYDVIIISCTLEDLDSTLLARQIRYFSCCNVPFLVLLSESSSYTFSTFDGFLQTPLSYKDVECIIQRWKTWKYENFM